MSRGDPSSLNYLTPWQFKSAVGLLQRVLSFEWSEEMARSEKVTPTWAQCHVGVPSSKAILILISVRRPCQRRKLNERVMRGNCLGGGRASAPGSTALRHARAGVIVNWVNVAGGFHAS